MLCEQSVSLILCRRLPQAPKEVAALDKLPLSDTTVLAATSGVAALKRKMDSLSAAIEAGAEGPGLRREVMEMRAVTEFKGQLQALSAAFVQRAAKHLCSVVRNMEVFSYKPQVVRTRCMAHMHSIPWRCELRRAHSLWDGRGCACCVQEGSVGVSVSSSVVDVRGVVGSSRQSEG